MINRYVVAAAGLWRWRNAHSITDLANLQADWMTRHFADLADDDLGPRWALYQTLAALGRAGVVVNAWRPGTSTSFDGEVLETRACITAFADDATKNWLDELLWRAGHKPGATYYYKLSSVIELYAPGCLEYDQFDGDDAGRFDGHSVERIGGDVTCRIGGSLDAGQVFQAFPLLRSRARAELRKSWHITICAPTWGTGQMFLDLLPLLYDSHRSPAGSTPS